MATPAIEDGCASDSGDDSSYVYEDSDGEYGGGFDLAPKPTTAKLPDDGLEKFIIGAGSSAATLRILGDLRAIRKLDPAESGIRVELPGEDTLYKWDVFLSKFPDDVPDCNLNADLKKYEAKHELGEVHLRVVFPGDYPRSPPFVRVLRPRFQFRTGRVTVGGSICMEALTKSGWSPVLDMEQVLEMIRSEMAAGEPVLDFKNPHPYSEEEARVAFRRVARDHGWDG